MVRHPIQTGGHMLDMGAGAVEDGIGAVFGRDNEMLQGATPAQTQPWADTKQFYGDRYGSGSKALHTLQTDPVGAALDASVLLGGTSSVVRGGARVAERAAVGGELGGARGAVRFALDPNAITGNPSVWRAPQVVPASQMVLDQPMNRAPLPGLPRPLTRSPVGDLTPAITPDAPRAPAGTVPLPDTHPAMQAAQASLPDGFKLDAPAVAAPARVPVQRPMPMAGETGPSISEALPESSPGNTGGVRPQPITDPLSLEQMRTAAQQVSPGDVLPIKSNQVGSVDEVQAIDKGRFAKATAPNERTALDSGVVRNWLGQPVPKVGPTDLVGWVRLNGGLADQGGELSHMGLTNAPRRGMDFVGQEHRFGPLVNNEGGMPHDDAALRAWEAGYFPDHAERPSTNDFLDALRGTHEGWDRRFVPEDQPQIDRFNAMRDERYTLEQQKADGEPVFADKSVPAGEDRPFPPVQAYEEWPAGGPDFAGNVNLNKLESPQDIKRALDFTSRQVGFDAATRGRISQAETERLAGELGMTPEKLLARRKGQALNAEEALAARQILAKSGNELVNMARKVRAMDVPGDADLAAFRQAWLRHAAIQEQVAGATAEAGRALAQFKMPANSRAVGRDVLTAMVEGGGGRDRIVEAADALIDASEHGPGVFNPLAEELAKPRWRDKAKELYYNFLLSGPQTHAVNMTSNLLTALGQFPEHATAAVMGKGRELFSKEPIDRVTSTEVGQRAYGMLAGFREGAKQFAKTAVTGDTPDHLSKIETQAQEAISGFKGKVIRTPSRLLSAEDELFKATARRMELHGQAARMAHIEGLKGKAAAKRIADLVASPTDDMLQRSLDYGRYLTFQRPLGPIASKIAALRSDSLIATAIIPFVRTPTNILKFAIERSPAAPMLKEWRADFKAGGARRDLAIAKVALGSALGATIYQAAMDGTVTGGAPLDPVKAGFMKANGWQPYSIKVGDKYYSYSRLDPFAMTIGVTADMANKRAGMSDKQADDYALLLTASIIRNMADKTWFSGASDFVQAVTDPQRYGKGYVRKMIAGALIPNVLAQTARTIDPTAHDVQSLPDALLARIPFASKSLPAKRDIWGQPIINEGGLGPDFVSPIWTSTDRHDKLSEEMIRDGARFSPPTRSIKVGGVPVKLDPQQFEQYSALAGQQSRASLEILTSQPGWSSVPQSVQAKEIKRIVTDTRKSARESLFGDLGVPAVPPPPGFNVDQGKGAKPPAPVNAATPPAGFHADGAAGGVNVYADLMAAIPGLQISSGFRTPEYQADMRRRGYHPASNSGHLDGSKLDLLPPPGKSMGWLRERVAQLYPNAVFNPEGDHLDVRFPGYFGAPALGGARSAGLRNPLEGMPPPPPGFTMDAGR